MRDTYPVVMRKMSLFGRDRLRYMFATSHLAVTSTGAGQAASRAVAAKRSKYATITRTHPFVAVALESSGSWSSEGLDFVLELGRRLTDATHDPLDTSYLFQRLSVAVQSGDAICFSSTLAC